MKKFSFNSVIRKQQPKGVFIEAIYRNLGISIAKNLFLPSEFKKKKNRIFMFFFVLSYGITITLLQIFIFLRFRIQPFKGVHCCSKKRLFEHSEASVRWCFKKTAAPKISAYFAYFPVKHPGWSSF